MAILNYVNTLEGVKEYLGLSESNTGDYIKLIFTKDGHIITHGLDYTKDYLNGIRGLVPDCPSNIADNGVLSKKGWENILSVLPIADGITSGDTTHIPTNDQVTKYISNSIKTAETLRFNGGVGYKDSAYYHIPVKGTEVSGFPKNCKVGDSYRILTNGITIAGEICQAGDMIICINDTGDAVQTGSSYWLVVQANIEGTSTVKINGTTYQIYTGSILAEKSIYAPSTVGTIGNILVSTGTGAPEWSALAISDAGELTLTNGTTTYVKQAIIANKLQKVLKPGLGLVGDNFDGSVERTWTIATASTSTLGGVKVGDNITVNSGTISVTKNNIVDALGYTPVDPSNASLYELILGKSDSTTNTTTNEVNPYINLVGTNTTSIQLIGSEKISVVGNNGKVTIGLGEASDTNYGGIKVGYTTSGRNYAVQLSDGKAYVNVPYRNITINSTSIGDNTLNFIPTGDVYIKADTNEDNTVDLSFGLSWYNISTGTYEYDSGIYN